MNARDECGSATVLACFGLAALVVITATLLHLGSAVSVRHRAQSAADLGALAAGVGLARGSESACAVARAVAERMHAEVVDCTVDDWDVVVTVTAPMLLSSLGIRDARAVARAGPAE
ncbi:MULTISPECIES: Rv3654c family TadE-like protein [Rhodococcus]|uniref:Flp pilus-assembly TadE/G-like family protein n=1 Tax=Rhodococcus oxybenzonivorans TaxID=1990687 RepID=A0AAE4UZG8_9NOCA|nr:MULTISPECIES: Rv3654c family TadE-like protein [Rhodococcus]MDV7242775.1 flp pilus-assembly TadE/G-like family protein [Rhodococcus oxybenzonivorans]MDV7265562.1 flp pilus-assembly TadE/G-like family protein [Rhodococcus oxybenzonivorans]MDV7275179.1 flp pilus-assembly TadE/G-like family protein [Rhodococcus oxybenzonivorans]MDV7334966.1 flp pilus-assembly TadE/G-like family protein [Rhodococcus oxybenzonivorans]MDV7345120.1 flp pilus-assembly TadE/G-like family protein [Rhodococcus oxybenz